MKFFDKLVNLASGLGTNKDKSTFNFYAPRLLTSVELENMARADWLARKIVSIIPYDMVREWRDWQAEDDQIELIEAYETKLGLQQKILDAMTRARLYGGSAIYIGTSERNISTELLPERIGKDGVKFLHVLSPSEITTHDINRDLLSPYFGEPNHYTVSSPGMEDVKIHPSRVIRFVGVPLASDRLTSGAVWGDPVLQSIYDAVENATSVQNTVASLVPEMKVDVISVPGLSDALATTDGTSRLLSRFTIANQMKSTINTLLLEGGNEEASEKWETRQINLSGMPELMQAFLQVAAGAADIPVTRLLGQSPSGLNATGDADVRNYYDHLSSKQEVELRPTLARLDEFLIMSALGSRPPEIHFTFAPLWQMDEQQAATVGKTKAETTKIYFDTGLFAPEALAEAVQNQLVEDGLYPGLEQAIKDAPEVDFTEPELEDPALAGKQPQPKV